MKGSFRLENKNVIILLKSFALGGAEKQALYLANHLQSKMNCNVFVYSYIKSDNSKLFFETCEKLEIKNLFLEKNPLSASGKFKYIKRRIKIFLFGQKLKVHNPDIIIPYLNPSSIIAALCYKTAGAKITFWHHRGPDYYRGDLLEKIAVKKSTLFIANSLDGKTELEEKLNFNINKSHFLANFSTIKQIYKIRNIDGLIIHKEKIVIGMIAHFRVQKLQDVLVKVYHELLLKYKDVHLVLAGNIHDDENDEKSSYKRVLSYISSNKLENNISILHNVRGEEILPYLDIGVLISSKEGMPNTIMEYMGYSLPVITTKHEGCVSLLGEKYPYYIDNEDKNDQFNKLEKLIIDNQERKNIGAFNNIRLIENFTIETYVNKLTTILNQ